MQYSAARKIVTLMEALNGDEYVGQPSRDRCIKRRLSATRSLLRKSGSSSCTPAFLGHQQGRCSINLQVGHGRRAAELCGHKAECFSVAKAAV